MSEAMKGDVLTGKEMKQRGITVVDGTRGGVEFRAPTYAHTIAAVLLDRGIIDGKHYSAACDYLEIKNAVYGFLSVKTMAGILQTGEAGTKKSHAELAYYTATKALGRDRDRIITIAMNEPTDDTLGYEMVFNVYRVAFHAMFEAMQSAIQRVREEKERELEKVLV